MQELQMCAGLIAALLMVVLNDRLLEGPIHAFNMLLVQG